ncbi:hypothetical protein SEUCBS140593_006792 [Sporothrix eucalyptigena]|uniref:Alpha/beta hydrolase fold-3 domain-containing protein n=1 Tax=Sporothrix eucalyptigena TaxID=1812306 RepID=A0ABP0C831_9PEZI
MEMEHFWKSITPHMLKEPFDVALYRIVMEECGSLATEPTGVTYEEVQCPGTVKPAIWCRPVSVSTPPSSLSSPPPPPPVILYLHGGGFISGSPASHRKLAAHLAKHAGTHALVLDYRRAPEHTFPSQIDDVVAAYKWLTEDQGIPHTKIALAGDSAGGNLSVATSLALREKGMPLPAAIAGFSPWLDMRVSGASYETNRDKDALAKPEMLPGVIQTYLGGNDKADEPLVDLLRTDLKGLPPMYLATGTSDILQSDAETLAKRAREAGIDVELETPKDLQHIYVCLAGNAKEADHTLKSAGAFIRSKMGL